MESTRVDSELPNKMANLDIMEEDTNTESCEHSQLSKSPPRILRKRKSLITPKSSNRRVSMKPRKHIVPENANPKQIEALYLNKKVKSLSQTLETIYEEPKPEGSNTAVFLGGRKIKRLLTFHPGNEYTKDKINKRRAKIKKLLGNKSFLNRKKIPMQVFLKTIECLELDEPVEDTENVNSNFKL